MTKAYLVLAWASINVNKYVIFCYLQIVFALLEGYIGNNGIGNTNFLCSFWFFVRFQGGGWFNAVAMATLIFQSTFKKLIFLFKNV